LSQTITISINGSKVNVPIGATIAFLIERFLETDPGLVVELNGNLVFPQKYTAVTVSEHDRVEFIHCGFAG
jgi:thiamine biosynthesis protein ThiS